MQNQRPTLLITAVLVTAISSGFQGADAVPPSAPRPRLGMNLAGPADWNTELPFVDVFKLSRPWISQKKGMAWGKGPKLELDKHGWVKRLAPDCWAETLLCTIRGGHYPGGRYTVLYDGRGRIEFGGAATVMSSVPGRMKVDVDPNKGAIFLRIKSTDPDDYVRHIRVIMPGFETTWKSNPFHPLFLQRWKGMACLRFMDWMKTNGSSLEHWGDRPKPDDATYSLGGVPLEVMLDLCNRLGTDAWFCMPHKADDEFVRRFAAVVRDGLRPGLRAYIEYSNEVWNNRFPQTRYARQKAVELKLGPPERPWEGGGKYYAKRSVEMFTIWEQVFGGLDRLVRVLAWQAGNVWWMENIVCTYQDAYKHADAIAIAPYFHFLVPAKSAKKDRPTADEVASWPLKKLLDQVENHALPAAIRAMQKTAEFARKYNLTMVAYEGGQHLVGINGGENNRELTRLFMTANADPRMGELYEKYLKAWGEAGGDLFCNFSSVSRWTKWGCWGLLQYSDEAPTNSPKFMAVMQWAKSLGQDVELPDDLPRE
ncbi:MAG: hypothetical protein GXP31_07735 [Kiritimatiellaeota bacterium]|nr:hypothetical protein [Kiritimatiellota bacterium]